MERRVREFAREWRLRRTPEGKRKQLEQWTINAQDWVQSQSVVKVDDDPRFDGRWDHRSWDSRNHHEHYYVTVIVSPDGNEVYYLTRGLDGFYKRV